MRQNAISASRVLNSWKEIAEFLDRGVRTVQRWERDLHLPVHRIGKGPRSPVYATIPELKFWLNTTDVHRPQKPQTSEPRTKSNNRIEESHRLLAAAHTLAQSLANATARQQRETEILGEKIRVMRLRMK